MCISSRGSNNHVKLHLERLSRFWLRVWSWLQIQAHTKWRNWKTFCHQETKTFSTEIKQLYVYFYKYKIVCSTNFGIKCQHSSTTPLKIHLVKLGTVGYYFNSQKSFTLNYLWHYQHYFFMGSHSSIKTSKRSKFSLVEISSVP